jgi:hypothetical protein
MIYNRLFRVWSAGCGNLADRRKFDPRWSFQADCGGSTPVEAYARKMRMTVEFMQKALRRNGDCLARDVLSELTPRNFKSRGRQLVSGVAGPLQTSAAILERS